MTYFWGKQVHLTRAVVNGLEAEPMDLYAMTSYVKAHIYLHAMMTYESIFGVCALDTPNPLYLVVNAGQEVGRLALHRLMYKYFYLKDGHALFMEIPETTSSGNHAGCHSKHGSGGGDASYDQEAARFLL